MQILYPKDNYETLKCDDLTFPQTSMQNGEAHEHRGSNYTGFQSGHKCLHFGSLTVCSVNSHASSKVTSKKGLSSN